MNLDIFCPLHFFSFVHLVLIGLFYKIIRNRQPIMVQRHYQHQSTEIPLVRLCLVDERRDILFLERAFAYLR